MVGDEGCCDVEDWEKEGELHSLVAVSVSSSTSLSSPMFPDVLKKIKIIFIYFI